MSLVHKFKILLLSYKRSQMLQRAKVMVLIKIKFYLNYYFSNFWLKQMSRIGLTHECSKEKTSLGDM